MSEVQTQKIKRERLSPRIRLHSPRDEKRLEETLAYKRTGRLLELGFGGGGFLSLAGRHFNITGIDHSHRVLSRIRSAYDDRIAVSRGDIEHEDLGRDHFDVVAAFNILEHLNEPARTVGRIYAGLRDTGILIGSVPNNQPVLGSISTMLTNLGDRTHVSTYPAKRWRQIFEAAGFREVTLFGEVLLTKYLAAYVRDPLWQYYAFNLVFVCRK
jgi:2-polyprenyl-3-methyl-5-hydroxy-6-metoxy-1,4-benzoquinol methylase